jgi:hypothetical protein
MLQPLPYSPGKPFKKHNPSQAMSFYFIAPASRPSPVYVTYQLISTHIHFHFDILHSNAI